MKLEDINIMEELGKVLSRPIEKGEQVWIADTARVFGRVKLGDECSVWFGAVLRGDGDEIIVGPRTNVQENAVLHVDPGYPVITGHDCIIGHGAIVHGAKLGDHVLVGMHATILNGARVGNFCIIGANTLIPEGMRVPDYSVVMGSPGKVVKQLTEKNMERVKRNAERYVELGKAYLMHYKSE